MPKPTKAGGPPVLVIVHPSGAGAPDPGCSRGPDQLLAGGVADSRTLDDTLRALGWSVDVIRLGTIEQPDTARRSASTVPTVRQRCARLAAAMTQAISRGYCPLVLGGDHACAIGTWKGAAKAVAKKGTLGLVWLDAHLDAHTPETTPSGMLHGMPLAVLLGRGDARLLRLTGGICIDPKHLCVVGARSFEPEEEKLLRELGVSVIDMARIQTTGLRGAIETAVQIAAGAPGGWGLSIDLDVIDPIDAPGVGSPVAAGLALESLVDSLHALAWRPGLVAVELAEYNPSRDPDQRTRLAAESIVRAIFAA